jgi:predicted 3-demethylubiquinone-9 3-methyltransferase (glyoxalase superfamily)
MSAGRSIPSTTRYSSSRSPAAIDQAEVERYRKRAVANGLAAPSNAGWLKDRYGLSWQIVPKVLGEMMSDPTRRRRSAPPTR